MKPGLTILLCFLLLLPAVLLGWSKEGHQTVAQIATNELTAQHALDRVIIVLPKNMTLMDIATCPDEIREHLRNPQQNLLSPPCKQLFPDPLPTGTDQQHFVNTPFPSNGTDSDITTACKNNCAVSAIEHYRTIFADAKQTSVARARALSFLVHIIGDIHQPLHAIVRNNDSGGNAEHVTLNGTNDTLHHDWDEPLVSAIAPTSTGLATVLAPEIIKARTDEQTTPTTSMLWAHDSFQFAKTVAYNHIPDANGNQSVATLTPDYVKAATPVIQEQLSRAGVRLAKFLAANAPQLPTPARGSTTKKATSPTNRRR